MQTPKPEQNEQVVSFYDRFAEKQPETGFNSLHLGFLDKMSASGLRSENRILEVGFGIAAVSYLLAMQVKADIVLTVDISPESIEKVKILQMSQTNLESEVSAPPSKSSTSRSKWAVSKEQLRIRLKYGPTK